MNRESLTDNIGFFYQEGEFVKQDFRKAVYWFTRAAMQGEILAQRSLGYCYFYGYGIKTDPAKAVFWYKKSAGKNDTGSLYNLGLCYKYGDGVKHSRQVGKILF